MTADAQGKRLSPRRRLHPPARLTTRHSHAVRCSSTTSKSLVLALHLVGSPSSTPENRPSSSRRKPGGVRAPRAASSAARGAARPAASSAASGATPAAVVSAESLVGAAVWADVHSSGRSAALACAKASRLRRPRPEWVSAARTAGARSWARVREKVGRGRGRGRI